MKNKAKIFKVVLSVMAISVLVFLYKENVPDENSFFPSCPFKKYTGYDCAGCGSQRAIHYLLNADFKMAWSMNPLLILSLPYVILGLSYQKILPDGKNKSFLRDRIFGLKATYIWLAIIILFWIGRNII